MLHRVFTEVQLLYRVGALSLQSGMSRAQQIPKCTMYMMRLCRHCQKTVLHRLAPIILKFVMSKESILEQK